MTLAQSSQKTISMSTRQLALILQNRVARKGQSLPYQEAIELAESLQNRAKWIMSQMAALDEDKEVTAPWPGA
jgi:hypothetical protein